MRFMLSEAVRTALFDIRDCILLAKEFNKGLTFEAFAASRLHFFATTRALEIISEASRRLPEDLRQRHMELPWRVIADAGNFYRHSYDNVDEGRVWRTVRDDLDALLAVVLAELDAA